jgi:hypothetical protein
MVKRVAALLWAQGIAEHMMFAVLMALSLLFYEERLLTDSGYYVFQVINNGTFHVEHHRFILILPELLPLLAMKAGIGLKGILCIYSVGHVLFFYVLFLIARYHYGDRQSGLLLLLLQTLGIVSGFFVPVFELYYSAGLLVLFSVILRRAAGWADITVLSVLAFFILTAHPYTYILFLFTLTMHIERPDPGKLRLYLPLIAVLVCIVVFKSKVSSDYERGKADAFLYNLQHADYGLRYLKALSGFMLRHYWELLLVEVLAVSLLVSQRKPIRAGISLTAFLVVLAMVNVSYHGFETSRYQEQVYFPLTFLAAFPLMSVALPHVSPRLRTVITVGLVVLVGHRANSTCEHGQGTFAKRTAEMKEVLKRAGEQGGSRFIVNERDLAYHANWSYPIETLLISSQGPEGRSITVCTDTDMGHEDNATRLLPHEFLFRRWEIHDVSTLNRDFFNLGHGNYSPLFGDEMPAE